MKRTGPTNPITKELISKIEEKGRTERFWRDIARRLKKPARQKPAVNLSKISHLTKEGDIVLVPGKVLSGGSLDHSLTISALEFSGAALSKIKESGSEAIGISEFADKNPIGKNVKIII